MTMPDWRLTVDTTDVHIVPGGAPNVWVVTGSGSRPTLEILTAPVVVPPPPPPPDDDEDTSPFVFPAQPSGLAFDVAERYAGLGEGFYAGQQNYRNPLPGPDGTLYAGLIQAGTIGAWELQGYRLWAPPGAPPATIRRALAKGRLS